MGLLQLLGRALLSGLLVAHGLACRYDAGEMERVAASRRLSLAGYRGGVAVRDPALLGAAVWLVLPGGEVQGPFRVVDYLRPGDHPPAGWAVDVDYRTWRRWITYRQITGDGPLPGITVLLYTGPPPRQWRVPLEP